MFNTLSLASHVHFYFLGVSLIAFFFFLLLVELCRVNVQQTALTILGKQLYIMQVTSLLKASTIYFVALDIPRSSAWWSFLGSSDPADGLPISGIFLDKYYEY